MDFWQALAERISTVLNESFSVCEYAATGGGCINETYRLIGARREYFVKLNSAGRLEMFAAEAEGLEELGASATVRVPRPLCWGAVAEKAYLVMEYVALRRADAAAMEALGRQLAALHRVEQPYFGWRHANTIGATAQVNTPTDDWITFWRTQRLGLQLDLAVRNGYGTLQRQGDKLLAELDDFFRGYRPKPALLHGDLWGGNVAADEQGWPVIFDPAVYYGDREADIAMTELFGGFPARFYAAYREAYPLDPGYSLRRDLYNLYHILNHLNLFGAAYRGEAEHTLAKLTAAYR
ncbi:MAG: fructosamine kinase family protein [Gammaproteobacteria bacterium]